MAPIFLFITLFLYLKKNHFILKCFNFFQEKNKQFCVNFELQLGENFIHSYMEF